MKNFGFILTAFLLLIIGYLIGSFFPILRYDIEESTVKTDKVYDHLIASFGVVATFLTIVIALFKESILSILRHPCCKMELVDEGIIEIIDSEQPNPKADAYECFTNIKNIGNSSVHGGEIIISKVLYASHKDGEKKIIRDLDKNKLNWESSTVTIPPKISKEILLFKIESPQEYGTPSALDTQYSPTHTMLNFNGIKLTPQISQKGIWEITYCLNYERGNAKHFILNIEWDGTWKSRKTEMKEVLKIELREI